MAQVIKTNRKTIDVAVPHTFKAFSGEIHSSVAEVRLSKEWLATSGLSAEEAAKRHVQTHILNFHSF